MAERFTGDDEQVLGVEYCVCLNATVPGTTGEPAVDGGGTHVPVESAGTRSSDGDEYWPLCSDGQNASARQGHPPGPILSPRYNHSIVMGGGFHPFTRSSRRVNV
ncbi:hypothetical protein GCM10025298_26000 [Natronobiforma cellulositropha]